MEVTPPWRQVWAKAPTPEPDEQRQWLPLHTHLTDTGALVRLLWDEWVGPRVRRVIAADCGGDERVAGEIASLAGALHDIGKCTPAFAGQVPEMRIQMESCGFRWPGSAIREDSRSLPHAVAGHIVVTRFLQEAGVPAGSADALAVVVGGHHGVPPDESQLATAETQRQLLGEGLWKQARDDLIEYAVSDLGLSDTVRALREVTLTDASQMLLTALVIMADWIASNSDHFPLANAWEQVAESSDERVSRGWRSLGLPIPWRATDEALTADPSDLLHTRFDVDFPANDVQREAVAAARSMTDPGMLLIEAAMGVGKTEASLLAAEVLAAKFGCSGVFYGLPTQATADAMFDRVLTWWQNVPSLGQVRDRGIALRHATASLNDLYRGLPRAVPVPSGRTGAPGEAPLSAGRYVDIGRDVADAAAWVGRKTVVGDAVAHHWTSGRKQASFADTVIATIDHELLAALASRHVVLRHLGLARQVVVLDEVHAADTWMQQYLHRALEWLGRYGVPVIAMSATLPPGQRRGMVQAYERGRRAGLRTSDAPRVGRRRREVMVPLPEVPSSDGYPLLTGVAGGVVEQRIATDMRRRDVAMSWLPDDLNSLARVVGDVVDSGGCVLVVRNTVRRAMQTYRALQGLWGEGVTLAHSRFVARDRLDKDEWLRTTFGPGTGDRAGRVVVATQVAEQSLDIDFDLLVTDLAPVDLVLQRVGRLHRHEARQRPVAVAEARCLVTGLQGDLSADAAPVLERGGMTVYGAHHLLRTAALLSEVVDGVGRLALPEQIPSLVRRCYGDESLGPTGWHTEMERAAREQEKADGELESGANLYRIVAPGASRTVVGLLSRNAGEAETSVGVGKQVRASDGGFEVIVLKAAPDGLRLLPQFRDDRVIPTDLRPDRETARLLARSMVRVPGWVTSNESWLNQVLDDLAKNWYRGWQRDPVLSGQLVLLLGADGRGTMGPFDVTYDTDVGLEVERG